MKGKLYENELQKIVLPDNTPIKLITTNKNIFDSDRKFQNHDRNKFLFELSNGNKKWFTSREPEKFIENNKYGNIVKLVA